MNKLDSAESMLPSTIPLASVSSDEFMPAPQSPRQRELGARVKQVGMELSGRLGLSRRRFFQTPAGMAAAFLALNDTFGSMFGVSRA